MLQKWLVTGMESPWNRPHRLMTPAALPSVVGSSLADVSADKRLHLASAERALVSEGVHMRNHGDRFATSSPWNRLSTRVFQAGRIGVFGMDWLLRRWYGVRSYSSSDSALLRIAATKATRQLTLIDGTRVAIGDLVIELHIWNERVPRLGLPTHSLAWACKVNRCIQHSLSDLARCLEVDRELRRYVAIRAEAFPMSERSARKLARLAAGVGLVQAAPEQRADWGHGMLAWLLTWACNPGSVSGKKSRPCRREFWMSAVELRARYLMQPAVVAVLLDRVGSSSRPGPGEQQQTRGIFEVGVIDER